MRFKPIDVYLRKLETDRIGLQFYLAMNEKEDKISCPTDDYQIRCPKLGHQIYFSYCRWEQMDFPCSKILDCWHEHFDVRGYLEAVLGSEAVATLFHLSPKPKMLSLVELIEQAKKNK